jgi:hypothetical protein
MSMSDFWHSPLIDAAVAGLKNPFRVDFQDSASLEKASPVVADPLIRVIEGATESSFGEKNDFQHQENESLSIIEHNSRIEAQEISRQTSGSRADSSPSKKIAVVASASETVGTHDALARLDQNGDGRIDQVEVKKGIRADESTSTFAALSQYQKSLEIHQKLSEADNLDAKKLFNSDEVKVEKLFDDENLEKDLYQEEYEDQPKRDRPEGEIVDTD